MSTPNYPASTLAKLFDLTERRVQQLARDSIIPKPKDGKYELAGSVIGYIKYLKSLAFKRQRESSEESQMRLRLLKAQAIKAELDLKASTKEMILTSDAIEDWSNMVLTFRAKMLALPYRAATLTLGLKGVHEVEKIIKTLVYEALNELAEYDPNNSSRSDIKIDNVRVDAENENVETEDAKTDDIETDGAETEEIDEEAAIEETVE